MTNTKELEIELIRKDISKQKVADVLNISLSCLYNKLSNKAEFKASEIYKIAKLLDLTPSQKESIFFAQGVEL